jgi:hypothetical protein
MPGPSSHRPQWGETPSYSRLLVRFCPVGAVASDFILGSSFGGIEASNIWRVQLPVTSAGTPRSALFIYSSHQEENA